MSENLLARNKASMSFHEKIAKLRILRAKKRREKNPQLLGETRGGRAVTSPSPGILTNNPNTSRSPSSALFILWHLVSGGL
jgi:hypothetical protein